MSISELDFIFPFVVFAYGFLVSTVLNWPNLIEKAENKIPHQFLQQLLAHRKLSFVCLWVGGLWSIQNLAL